MRFVAAVAFHSPAILTVVMHGFHNKVTRKLQSSQGLNLMGQTSRLTYIFFFLAFQH